ncbi:MAG TPA: cyclic nucleotide-binding domain-containing protein [Solirubrobacteraceae bacterium]|nr:cyclic nucleotide-binding domain-containing protein [Solirubrobacteraceae bacterium]
MQTIEDLIAQAPVFGGLEPGQLKLIAGCGRNEHVAGGSFLFREGEPASRFFLIRRGSVAIEVQAPGRGALTIETLHAGDTAGISWLFEPYRWQLDARALEPSELIGFDAVCLRGKVEADHELGYELMRRFTANLADRLQATRFQLLDVYGHAPASA